MTRVNWCCDRLLHAVLQASTSIGFRRMSLGEEAILGRWRRASRSLFPFQTREMARQEIQTFYQRLKGEQPKFETAVVGTDTVCTLEVPGVTRAEGSFTRQIFTVTARNKKSALALAAEQGLDFLKQQSVYQSSKPSSLLWEVISKLMTFQALKKEPEFEGHLLLAQRFNEGWIPVQLFATARPVNQWAKQHLPGALKSPEAFVDLIQKHLQSEAMPQSVKPHIENGPDCHCIRRRDHYPGRNRPGDVLAALNASVDHGAGRTLDYVSIPTDLSSPIKEGAIEGGGWFWSKLAAALNVPWQELLYWDKFGRNKDVYLPEDVAVENLEDAQLIELLSMFLGPIPASKEDKLHQCSEAIENGHHDDGDSEFASHSGDVENGVGHQITGIPLTRVRQPALYSRARCRALNQRASWLLGKPVHGDALISYCRLRPCEWRTPSVKWASFPVAAFWAWAGASLPSAEYARSTEMPQLARLPRKYRNSKAWFGSSPVDLLAHHISDDILTAKPEYCCKASSDDPDATWECTASMGMVGDDHPIVVDSTDCATEDAARQQAALAMLHEFEARAVRLLRGVALEETEETPLCTHEEGVKVKVEGNGALPQQGTIAWIAFRIEEADGQHPGRLLAANTARLEWGSGGAIPLLETLVAACKPGGTASCNVELPPDLQNPLSKYKLPVWLEVSPELKVKFVGTAQTQTGQAMFVPSMSTQRHERMEKLLKEESAETVVDIGCGEGRLTEHLLKQSKGRQLPIRRLAVVDLNGNAARQGAKRICLRNPGIFEGEAAPQLEAYQADVACEQFSSPEAWGCYHGVDAAIVQEVIEHLDPEPLAWLPQCMLGALQPRLLLLSTPNFEYNAVLHYLHSQLLPNGLRNSDHRFEWTREQFQAWCGSAAGKYGYSVSYQEIGRAAEEARALADPSTAFHGKDVGGSTQVALFKRLSSQVGQASGQLQASCVFDSTGLLAAGASQFQTPASSQSAAEDRKTSPKRPKI